MRGHPAERSVRLPRRAGVSHGVGLGTDRCVPFTACTYSYYKHPFSSLLLTASHWSNVSFFIGRPVPMAPSPTQSECDHPLCMVGPHSIEG